MSDNPTTKVCSDCKLKKPLSEFYSNKGSRDGYILQCKDCYFKRRGLVKRSSHNLRDGYKICRICRIEKPLSEFQRQPLGKQGRASQCYDCVRAKRGNQKRPKCIAPDGFKCCRKQDKCLTPNGPILPATNEYFMRDSHNRDRLDSYCRTCCREAHRKSSARHAEDHKLRRRLERQTNPDKVRLKSRMSTKRRRDRKRGLEVTFTEQDWFVALMYFNHCCAYCGHGVSLFDRYLVLQQDHYVPLSKDGPYTKFNIVPACQTCNLSKNNEDAVEWILLHFGKKRGEKIIAAINRYFASLSIDKG